MASDSDGSSQEEGRAADRGRSFQHDGAFYEWEGALLSTRDVRVMNSDGSVETAPAWALIDRAPTRALYEAFLEAGLVGYMGWEPSAPWTRPPAYRKPANWDILTIAEQHELATDVAPRLLAESAEFVDWPVPAKIAPYTGPALVYGSYFGSSGYLVVVPLEWAKSAADEYEQFAAATTWGDACAVSRSMTALEPPIDPGAFEDYESGEPYDPYENSPMVEGDWPAIPGRMTLDFLPEDWIVGSMATTVLNGEFLAIGESEVDRLLIYAAAAGAAITRDDALIDRLGPH